mgnify:FL=1
MNKFIESYFSKRKNSITVLHGGKSTKKYEDIGSLFGAPKYNYDDIHKGEMTEGDATELNRFLSEKNNTLAYFLKPPRELVKIEDKNLHRTTGG